MHKAFVHGAHCVSDFSGFATGRDEGIANEKLKAVVVSVVSRVTNHYQLFPRSHLTATTSTRRNDGRREIDEGTSERSCPSLKKWYVVVSLSPPVANNHFK